MVEEPSEKLLGEEVDEGHSVDASGLSGDLVPVGVDDGNDDGPFGPYGPSVLESGPHVLDLIALVVRGVYERVRPIVAWCSSAVRGRYFLACRPLLP